MSLSPTLEISTSLLMFPIKFSFNSLPTHLSNLTFLGLATLQMLKVRLCHLVYFVYNTTYEESWMGCPSKVQTNSLSCMELSFSFISPFLLPSLLFGIYFKFNTTTLTTTSNTNRVGFYGLNSLLPCGTWVTNLCTKCFTFLIKSVLFYLDVPLSWSLLTKA
jgi:hypothetical protein